MKNPSFFRFSNGTFILGEKTYIMGIINVTPDSFSDGGNRFSPEAALEAARELAKAGADILDIGGQSTAPHSVPISAEEEWKRLAPILPRLVKEVCLPISIDTFYPLVAARALECGCHIINDVSGTVSREMAEVVKEYGAGYILMHNDKEEDDDICRAVHHRLEAYKEQALSFGLLAEQLCFDPGIGFQKDRTQDATLLANIQQVKVEGYGFLVGASRKRVINAALHHSVPPSARDAGTIAAHTIALLGGADFLRVHDVSDAVQAAAVADFIRKEKKR